MSYRILSAGEKSSHGERYFAAESKVSDLACCPYSLMNVNFLRFKDPGSADFELDIGTVMQ